MNKIIEIEGRRSSDTQQEANNFWIRRLAFQVLSIMPDQRLEALQVIHEAERLLLLPGPFTPV